MADEENETKQINDKDENMMDDSTKPEIQEDKKDVKDDLPEPKSDKTEGTQNSSEKAVDKSENEEDEDDDEGDEDDAEDDKESLPPGLLEQPLEVEGKRQKKKVERLSATMMRSPPERPQLEIEEGSGTKLGDIPYVTHYINITKAADLKTLHKLLFLRAGTINEIKRNIRKFSGITEGEDSKEHEKRLAICNKMSLTELKNLCLWLGVKQSGTKADLIERTMSFLKKPEDQGAEVKKKRNRSKPAAKKGTKRKRKTKKTEKEDKPKKKAKKSKPADDEKEEDEEEDKSEEEKEDDAESEDDEDVEDEDSEEEAPKKKKPKLEVKKKEKNTPKKTVKENGKKEKASPKKVKAAPKKEKATPTKAKSPKKETKKKAPPKKPVPELSDSLSDDSDDSDEEPLAQTIKPPSDDEIKKVVKTILDGADLETVTMKTVVKQVYAKYPKFDLSDRKDFIKSTVREVIS